MNLKKKNETFFNRFRRVSNYFAFPKMPTKKRAPLHHGVRRAEAPKITEEDVDDARGAMIAIRKRAGLPLPEHLMKAEDRPRVFVPFRSFARRIKKKKLSYMWYTHMWFMQIGHGW